MGLDSNVRRFVILGSARTGSNLLLSLLSAHSHIKTYGELFNLDVLLQGMLREALEDPISFLQRRVYKAHRPEIAAVGFKMFYDHLTKDYLQKPIDVSQMGQISRERMTQFRRFVESNYAWETLDERFRATWEFLRADRSLAVIHLKRRNMLHTLISLKRALITDEWWSLKSSSQATASMRLDPEECCRYFDKLENFAAEADTAFADHPKIDVTYEDFTNGQQQETSQRIFTFLNVSYEPVTTRMKKQSLASLPETIDNYAQLKSYFQQTRWNVFFE
jgi:LPS sulfotransferase NodH